MAHNSLIAVNPYLFFSGNCREALAFYNEVLGGELEVMPFEGSPLEVPPEYNQNVMHATMKIGDMIIMASDGMPGQEIPKGSMTSLSLNYGKEEDAESVFNALSKGGKITMEYQKTFWGSMFGSFTDKFGIDWMVSCDISGTK